MSSHICAVSLRLKSTDQWRLAMRTKSWPSMFWPWGPVARLHVDGPWLLFRPKHNVATNKSALIVGFSPSFFSKVHPLTEHKPEALCKGFQNWEPMLEIRTSTRLLGAGIALHTVPALRRIWSTNILSEIRIPEWWTRPAASPPTI